MSRLHLHPESHLVERIGWMRAAVLGANDGIVSTASLIVGVAAVAANQNVVLIAGVAGRRHRKIIRHGYLKIGTTLEMQSKARQADKFSYPLHSEVLHP